MMYFKKAGKHNSAETLETVKTAIKEKDIKYVVVASSNGHTAKLFAEAKLGVNLIWVTHAAGFRVPGEIEAAESLRNELSAAGVKVLTATHVLSGAERGISNKAGGMYPIEIMANALRMMGQGTKVCVEVSVMALDAGLIPFGEDIIAVGGTNEGADTAVIIQPAHASDIFGTWISEILCKPARK